MSWVNKILCSYTRTHRHIPSKHSTMQSEESGILDLDNCDLWEVVCGRQKPVLKAKSGSEEKKKKPAKRSKDDDEEEEQKPAKRSKKEKEKEKEKKHESKRSTKPLVEKKKKSKKVAVEATGTFDVPHM